MRLFLLLLLAGCADLSALQRQNQTLITQLKGLEANRYAVLCAPEALAMAQAHREFAELEFRQGNASRAAEHLAIARQYADQAIQATATCTLEDRDQDGIPDLDDRCPDEPEDKDDDRDEDGCPEAEDQEPLLVELPPPLPGDSDGDGLLDADDACPDVPEDPDGFRDADGCPDLDNDSDGILDAMDECPMLAEDIDGFEDEDGCPDPDNDGDGVLDVVDRCPDQPEDRDGDRDTDGCPDLDEDNDGIPDDVDGCPAVAENVNGYLDDDGCPDDKPQRIEITRDQIVIKEQIQFETGKARIRPMSFPILDDVIQVLRDYPAIRVRIEGHTDNVGEDAMNARLSKSRADAVFEYIIGKGVDARRLTTEGFGETRPIDSNLSAEGRQRNRRVEFHILESDPTAPAGR
ncbi:MAG: OmpA family protein [Deltaproteobacteria bacterium]|nr:OmpA family protein [Deltaproteobacteria bacterium]